MDPSAAARKWADTWCRCWASLDPDSIVALYASDAVVSTEPFREPLRGRDEVRRYVRRVFAEEDDPQVHVGAPIVEGDRAAVAWWASLREDGVDTTLAGTSLLRFDSGGLVIEQWDTWNVARRRLPPPSDGTPFG